MRLAFALFVCGCWSAPPPQVPVPPMPPREPELPALAELHDAWIDAVGSRDPARIAGLLKPPFAVYLDDGTTGRTTPACERWRRAVQTVTTVRERDQLAACIAGTVHHTELRPAGVFDVAGDPTHPTGVVSLDPLHHLVDEPVREVLAPLALDHAFVHGATLSSSDYDFTLAVSGGRITFVALTSHPGC